jgi:hypothetical protein
MGCPSRKVLMSQRATVARLSSRRKYYAYSTIKSLIRARLVVQVHPGPPSNSVILAFPLSESLSPKTIWQKICQITGGSEAATFQRTPGWRDPKVSLALRNC